MDDTNSRPMQFLKSWHLEVLLPLLIFLHPPVVVLLHWLVKIICQSVILVVCHAIAPVNT